HQLLKLIEGGAVDLPRVQPQGGSVLVLEQRAELLPRHTARFLVQVVIQLVFEFAPLHLGDGDDRGLGALAFPLAGKWVMPLEHQVRAALEALHPNDDTFLKRHGVSLCWGRRGTIREWSHCGKTAKLRFYASRGSGDHAAGGVSSDGRSRYSRSPGSSGG